MLRKKREKEDIIKKYKIPFFGISLEKMLFKHTFPKDKQLELKIYKFNLFFSMIIFNFKNIYEFLASIKKYNFLNITKVYETPTKIVIYAE